MNVLLLPSWYPTDPADVYGSFFREQAIALQNAAHNLFVLNASLVSIKPSKEIVLNKYEDSGLVVYQSLIRSFGYARVPFLYLAIYKRHIDNLYNAMIMDYPALNIDVIHAHSYYPAGVIACELGKKINKPVVITEHRGSLLRNKVPIIHKILVKRCLERSNKFICVSYGLREKIANICNVDKTKIMVIPNMYAPVFRYSEWEARVDNRTVIISVGALTPGKRQVQLVKCFVRAFKNDPEVILQLIGEGSERSKIESIVQNEGMSGRIILFGQKKHKEVAMLLQKGDFFVLSSAKETFGVVYVEALACGLPVIATKNGGAEDIVNQSNGVLIDVDNDVQLVNALIDMKKKIHQFDRKKIAESAELAFSERAVVKQLTNLYNTLKV